MGKDVDLVVRARAEGLKAFEAISRSLENVVDTTGEVSDAAKKTGSFIDQLKTKFVALNRDAGNLANVSKISTSLDKASAAVERLAKTVAASENELSGLEAQSKTFAASEERLRAQSDAVAASVRRQQTALAALKTEAGAANKEVADLERALKRTEAAKAPATQPRSSTASLSMDKLPRGGNIPNALPGSSAQDSARAIISGQLEQARTQAAGSAARVTAATEALSRDETALKSLSEEIRATGTAQRTLTGQIDSSTAALAREQQQLAATKEGLVSIQGEAAKASAALSAVGRADIGSAATGGAGERIAGIQARMAAERATVQAQIDGLSEKRQATTSPTELVAANRAKLEARREYVQATDEVARLARAMREAEAPTNDMGAALGRAYTQARLAKEQYLALAEATQRIKSGPSTGFQAFSQRISAPAPAPAAAPVAPIANPIDPGIAPAAREGAEGTKSLRDALKGLYGDSRESLSLMQRLRGEILGLTASYIGFQAAIQGIRSVIDVFRTLEAAQSRLGAVFNQDTPRVTAEISYLRREANRLGIEFGTLADEYGKFMIAAKSANFASQDSRKIFISVAEAARVNKLSTEQVSGVFLALTQMMSKGTVQSEELKRQLGDRLPGAMNIMADALHVSTAELEKMMSTGEVLANSDTMISFANELTKRFGPQLASALVTTTTEMGRFQNNLQAAAMEVANGGLIEGFTSLLKVLNVYFQSNEGREFFLSLGSGAKVLFDALVAIVPYMGTLKTILGAIIALKVAQAFMAIGGVLKSNITDLAKTVIGTSELSVAQRMAATSTASLTGASAALRTQLTGLQVALAITSTTGGAVGATMGVAATAVGAFRTVAMATMAVARGLFAAMGGLAGIVVTGLTVAAGYWLTSVESGTEALSQHRALIDKVVTGYEEAKDKAGDWASKLKDVSKVELVTQIQKATEEKDKAVRGVKAPTALEDAGFGALAYAPVSKELTALVEKFKTGSISVAEFKKQVDALADADPGLDKKLLTEMVKAAENADAMTQNLDKLKALLKLYLKQELTETEKKLLGLSEALKDTGAEKATKDMKAFADAINELKTGIPALAVELKKLKDQAEALESLRTAIGAAGGDPKLIQQAYGAFDAKNNQINSDEVKGYVKQFGGDKIPESMVAQIYGKEGYRDKAYLDQGGTPTIGYGSTRVDGKAVQMGDTITLAEAVKQMVADLSKFTAMVDSATGNAKLGENQRNALTSMVYNTGNTTAAPTRAIFEAIKQNRPDAEVADLISKGVATVKGEPSAELRARRQKEAALYLTPDDRLNGQDSGATNYDRSKAKLDAQRDFDKNIDDANKKRASDAANQKKINDAPSEVVAKREVAIQEAVAEAQRKALEEGVELGKERIQTIKDTTAALWDQQNVNAQAKEGEEKVNALYKLRQQLLEELKVAKEQGDATQITATKSSLEKVNEETREAIRLAIQYWQEVGGDKADAAIAKLRIMGAQTLKNKTEILTAGQANEKLASGMTKAFDTAAQGIGKAIAGTGTWKDAIKGVGLAFLNFAADFMREIALMIIKQLILNALQKSMGGGGGAGATVATVVNAMVSTAHTGGVVGGQNIGVGNASRIVNPAWFEDAQRFHGGGIPGLAPNEVPAILKRNEEVLTETDPRNMLNGGGKSSGGGGPQSIKSVLVMDPNMIPDAMSEKAGEQVVLAHIKANKDTIASILRK